jgi:hypothetical protein
VRAAAGANAYTPEEAGYTVSGGRFRFVAGNTVLPDASKFAANVGSFGDSVQLVSSGFYAVLGISTCTTTTCAAGGTPATDAYNGAFAVFNPSTHALIASNGASPAMAVGDAVSLALFYSVSQGNLQYTITDTTAHTSFSGVYHTGAGLSFGSPRVGTEFAADPFSQPPAYNAPVAATGIAAFTGVTFTNYASQRGSITGTHWTSHKLIWTRNGLSTGAVNAMPSSPGSSGTAFSNSLEP